MRRVVITGLGILSPVGIGKEENWESITSGKSGVAPITLFDASQHKTQFAGELKNFDPTIALEPREVKRYDRFCHMIMAAADEAMADSGLMDSGIDPELVGTIIGVGIGGMEMYETQANRLYEKGPTRVSPYLIPGIITDSAAGLVSIRYNLKGPNFDVSSACASAGHAIGECFNSIRFGKCDAAVTGGVEAAITPLGVAGFNALKAISTRNDSPETASRPFDRDRDGFIMAEGGGVLVLEEYEYAKKRGANIYAELKGYGATGDAYHITAPSETGEGAARAMKLALKDAELNPGDIAYVNAHGTSTPYNDRTETAAMKTAFGDAASKLQISSTKSMTGHMLGGTAACEAVYSIFAIKNNTAPPTINYQNPDPECDLDYIPNEAREFEINYAMSTNLGFGGHNVSLIFGRI